MVALEALSAMVTDALKASDALQLWDVSIGLDRARLAIGKLQSGAEPPPEPVDLPLDFAPLVGDMPTDPG
jgi:hypothetical protein